MNCAKKHFLPRNRCTKPPIQEKSLRSRALYVISSHYNHSCWSRCFQARFTNTCIYHFQMKSWVMSCTTDPLWLSPSQPVSSEWQLHHPAYICCIAVSLLELTLAAPVIIGRGVRFPDEVGSEMCNALIGREGEISPPLPQRLWFQQHAWWCVRHV